MKSSATYSKASLRLTLLCITDDICLGLNYADKPFLFLCFSVYQTLESSYKTNKKKRMRVNDNLFICQGLEFLAL